MTPTGHPLLDRLRAQEHEAFGALVERDYTRVGRYLARLVGDREIAAELTQETFLRAYQALPRLADESDVTAWLFRIATNLARQHHRHGQLICWSRLEPRHAASGTFEDGVARHDAVRRALSRLTLDQRVCLLLYAWTGYTCAEIGHIMGRTTSAVRMLLVRARRRFRAAYGALDDGPDALEGPDAMGDTQSLGGKRTDSGVGSGTGCGAVGDLLPLYPRGDLPLEAFLDVTRHLKECERCREALREVQALYRLVQRHLHSAAVAEISESPAVPVPLLVRRQERR